MSFSRVSIPAADIDKTTYMALAVKTIEKLKWQIDFITANGLEADTPASSFMKNGAGETIRIWFDETELHIESSSMSWATGKKKNRRNVEKFLTHFEEVKAQITAEEIQATQQWIIENKIQHDNEDPYGEPAMNLKDMYNSTGVFAGTMWMIGICVIIYLLMLAAGADWLKPDVESLIAWGGNVRSLTVAESEWWRLVTCIFEHVGLIHLLVNMLSFYFVGNAIEPLIGKWRFITAFLVTGIAGSLASLWWNPNIVSAGASGAIFGMFGLLLAILVTDLVPSKIRKNVLPNIGLVVAVNLFAGFKPGVDYAAHIGGLLAGLLIGFIYYLFMRRNRQSQGASILAASVFGVLLTVFALNTMNDVRADFSRIFNRASEYENEGLKVFEIMEKAGDLKLIKTINTESLPAWKKYQQEIGKLDSLQLPQDLAKQRTLLKEYSDLRIVFFETLAKEIEQDEGLNDETLEETTRRLEKILNELSGEGK